jgi:hypothetical protein
MNTSTVTSAAASWIHTYLRDLSRHCQSPVAATTAGVELIDVLQLRAADPAFAAQESLAMASIRDLLLAEAIRRALGHPAPGGEKAAVKRFGSERILLRLLEFFVPEWPRTKSRATVRPLSPTPASRAELAPIVSSPVSTTSEIRPVPSHASSVTHDSHDSHTSHASAPDPAKPSVSPNPSDLPELQAALKVAQERLRKVRLAGNNGPCRAADTVKDLTARIAALSQR